VVVLRQVDTVETADAGGPRASKPVHNAPTSGATGAKAVVCCVPVQVEEASHASKSGPAIGPIFHRSKAPVEAHVFTARSAPRKFAAVQMLDVNVPTTGGRPARIRNNA